MTPQPWVLKKQPRLRMGLSIFGSSQKEYVPLPGLRGQDEYRMVTTRWHLTWQERLRLLVSGDLWVQMLTFGKPLQPIKILTEEPTPEECGILPATPKDAPEQGGQG